MMRRMPQPPPKKFTLRGCVTTLVLVAIVGYGGFALLFFGWFGSGFYGAMVGRHAPERLRSETRIAIYDHVIEVEPGTVTFRPSKWARVRRRIFFRRASPPPVQVLTPANGEVVAVPFDVGGGRSGTRQTTPWMTGYDIVLREAGRDVMLIRLPYNKAEDAAFWRELIASKLARKS
jgi:hypothetical protein